MSWRFPLLALAAPAFITACGSEGADERGAVEHDGGSAPSRKVTPAPDGEPYDTLDEWHLFADARAQTPVEGVIPFEVISPLFADYALKKRYLWVPGGKQIGYHPTKTWDFPVGTILVKTFGYPPDLRNPEVDLRLIETRLLVRESARWATHVYVWDEDQTGATRKVAGATIPIEFVDTVGERRVDQYAVPNTNECLECHGEAGRTNTLGGRTRQLNRSFDYEGGRRNQIDFLAARGLFEHAPVEANDRESLVDPFGEASLELRVRSYLDANCGSCHDDEGVGSTGSGLELDWDSTDSKQDDPANWGVCKIPTSAGGGTCGLTFDVVPGKPDASILVCRMTSEDREVRMPPLGRNLEHTEGVQLVREWVAAMTGSCN